MYARFAISFTKLDFTYYTMYDFDNLSLRCLNVNTNTELWNKSFFFFFSCNFHSCEKYDLRYILSFYSSTNNSNTIGAMNSYFFSNLSENITFTVILGSTSNPDGCVPQEIRVNAIPSVSQRALHPPPPIQSKH